MANVDMKKIITDFSSYFGKEVVDLNFNFDKVPEGCIGKDEILGLRNLVFHVSHKNKVLDLRNLGSGLPFLVNQEYDVVQDEWVEYALIHMGCLDGFTVNKVLKDLNAYIVDKVYFVGNELGPVDVLLYYILYNVVVNLTFQEKEKYLHISRWFDNVQQNGKTRLWRSLIPFSKTMLYRKKCCVYAAPLGLLKTSSPLHTNYSHILKQDEDATDIFYKKKL